MKSSDTGTRTQVAWVKARYPNQLDYIGLWKSWVPVLELKISQHLRLRRADPKYASTDGSAIAARSKGQKPRLSQTGSAIRSLGPSPSATHGCIRQHGRAV
jgi:hypothetical protein